MRKLSSLEARTDLTDRELAKIIGGLLGSLCMLADPCDLRNAVRWWAETDELWISFQVQRKAVDEAMAKVREAGDIKFKPRNT